MTADDIGGRSTASTAEILNRLRAVTTSFSRTLAPAEIARIAVTEGIDVLGAASSALVLLSADGAEFLLIDHEGMDPTTLEQHRRTSVAVRSGGGDAIRTRAPVFFENRDAYFATYPEVAPITAFTDGSKAYLPLEVDGGILGVLAFGFAEWRAFDASERAFMSVLAAVTAQAFDRTRRIAEREDALREVESASKMKDEFLATVSHELRTPLNAILGWSSMLLSPLDNDSFRKGAVVIERNARALARLVDDVLDVSRITRGKLRVEHTPIDVTRIVRAVVEAVAPAARAKAIRLETLVDDDAGRVLGDADRLQQVVWNLLSNAVKFTPRGGTVTTTALQLDAVVRVSVSDTGIGIEPNFLPHVFERFRQFDSSTTRPHGGLGLGLAIARHLVELHGGTIGVRSGGTDKGATFTVELPALALETLEIVPTPKGPQLPRNVLAGLQVLVADDVADSRDLIRRVLENAGAEVRVASSARDAMAAVASQPPDALVADIGMPDADGYMLMRWIRALDAQAGGRVPAIALTGYASDLDRRIALGAGYQEHLSKPTQPSELVRAVARVVGRP